MEKSSFFIKSSDNINLFVQSFPVEKSKFSILLIHGLGEHSGRYSHVIEKFNKNQISVFTLDTRGHGKSEGKRGHSPSFSQLMDDIQLFIQVVKPLASGQKRILYGHSMGGLLVTSYAILKSASNVDGLIVSSPALQPAFTPPKLKIVLGQIFQYILPSLTLNNELDVNGISRNKDTINSYLNDSLNHDQLSIKLGLDLLKYGEFCLENFQSIKIPIILFHGKKDSLTSYNASESTLKLNLKNLQFYGYENAYHELHNEEEFIDFFNKIISWFENF